MALKDFFTRFKKTEKDPSANGDLKEELREVLFLYTKSLESLRDELHEVKEDCLKLLKERGLPLDES